MKEDFNPKIDGFEYSGYTCNHETAEKHYIFQASDIDYLILTQEKELKARLREEILKMIWNNGNSLAESEDYQNACREVLDLLKE